MYVCPSRASHFIPQAPARGPGDTRRKGGQEVTRCPDKPWDSLLWPREAQLDCASLCKFKKLPGIREILQGWARLYCTLWKAVSTGASWSGRGFRWEFSTAVRQYQYKQSHFQRDSAGSCLRVVLPGSLAGSGVEGARSTMCPGVSVYPRENKGSVIKSLE